MCRIPIVILAAAVPLISIACGSFLPVVEIESLSSEERDQVDSITIFNQAQLLNMSYDIVAFIEGHSCQNQLFDPPATRAEAIEQLKYHAWQQGANGISNIQCGAREGTSFRTNCWELISCTAEAVHVKD